MEKGLAATCTCQDSVQAAELLHTCKAYPQPRSTGENELARERQRVRMRTSSKVSQSENVQLLATFVSAPQGWVTSLICSYTSMYSCACHCMGLSLYLGNVSVCICRIPGISIVRSCQTVLTALQPKFHQPSHEGLATTQGGGGGTSNVFVYTIGCGPRHIICITGTEIYASLLSPRA
jgi:hypothetical protein